MLEKGIFISEKATKGLDIPVTGRCMVVVDKVTGRKANHESRNYHRRVGR
jgi:hypothetical protein